MGCRRYTSSGEHTTVWGDMQRKLGNYAPLPERFKPEAFVPKEDVAKGSEQWLEGLRTEEQLEEAEDLGEMADDTFLDEYRYLETD